MLQMPRIVSAMTLLAALIAVTAAGAQAPGDVPRTHWAYGAIETLAAKGLVKGFPPAGRLFGDRTATRYEMATVMARVLSRVDELLAARPAAPAAPAVTLEQLDGVRRLVSEFRVELTVIGTDMQKVQDQLAELRTAVDAAKGAADAAKGAADQAGADAAAAKKGVEEVRAEIADIKEANTAGRAEFETLSKTVNTHKFSGYLQGRLEAFDTGRTSLFTAGGSGGTGQTPSVGGPAVGGPYYGFLIRRARLKMSGQLTGATDYAIQFDVPSTGAIALKDAFVNVADLPAPNMTATFGLFAPAFGIELPASSSGREAPERSLAFSDTTASLSVFKTSVSGTGGVVTAGSVVPLFNGQDRDLGAAITWHSPSIINARTKVSLGVINGEGRAAGGVRNQNNGADLVARAQTTVMNGHLDLGLSGYYGSLAVRGGPPAGSPAAPVAFTNAYRMLAGADIRYFTPWGTVLRAEYIGGLYEMTPDRAMYLQNNHTYGWYVTAKHPVSKRLELAAKYNEFYPIADAGKTAAGLGRMALVRKSVEGGLLYYFDEATRFRAWYTKGLTPYDPSAASGPLRSRLGMITGEIQITY